MKILRLKAGKFMSDGKENLLSDFILYYRVLTIIKSSIYSTFIYLYLKYRDSMSTN